jgi:hypothetical protein
MSKVKMIYAKYVTTLRKGANQLGIVKVLDRWASHSRFGLWLRSLLSIWDLKDFLSLDLPWWTFKSIDLVERFLRENPAAKVFEWGSGASTGWLAKHSKFVISVEHDQAWASELGPHLPDNAQVSLFEPTKSRGKGFVVQSRKRGMQGLDFSGYCQSITGHASRFDVIVIDGRAREECLNLALLHLEPGGGYSI